MGILRSSIGAAALVSASALAAVAEPVLLGMPLQLTASDGGIYATAMEQGFFADEGIELEIVSLDGAGTVMPQLLQGRLTMSYLRIDALFGAMKAGQTPVPLTFFYNDLPFNSTELSTLAASDITGMEQLDGHKIGVTSLTWDVAQLRAALRSVGLEPGTDVEIVAVGAMAAGRLALEEDRVQALRYPFYWNDLMASQGLEINRIALPGMFAELSSAGFVTTTEMVEERPELLEGFGRAYNKGVQVCYRNPEACVEAFWRMNPAAAPVEADRAAVLELQAGSVRSRLERVIQDGDGQLREPGAFNFEMLQNFVTMMQGNGEMTEVPEAELNAMIETSFTNDFVAAYSDFDAAELQALADGLN